MKIVYILNGNALICDGYRGEKPNYVLQCSKECPKFVHKNILNINIATEKASKLLENERILIMNEKNKNSCSDVQQKYEKIIFEKIQNELKINFSLNPKIYLGKSPVCHMQPDFYSEDNKIIGEIFAHVGKLKPGQWRKITKDILKMLLIDKKESCLYRKIIVICDKTVEKELRGNSFVAESIREFGIEINYIELTKEQIKEIEAAQKKQNMVNAEKTI